MANKARVSLGLAILAGMSLTACGKKESESDIFATGSLTSSGQAEDQIGTEFGKAHRADPNSEPVKVDANSVPPVDYTSEPLPTD